MSTPQADRAAIRARLDAVADERERGVPAAYHAGLFEEFCLALLADVERLEQERDAAEDQCADHQRGENRALNDLAVAEARAAGAEGVVLDVGLALVGTGLESELMSVAVARLRERADALAQQVETLQAIIAAARQWKAAREARDRVLPHDCTESQVVEVCRNNEVFRIAEAALLALLGTPEGT